MNTWSLYGEDKCVQKATLNILFAELIATKVLSVKSTPTKTC